MSVIGVIPARMASTRFPGKPLVDIGGKTMIQRVYEQAKKCEALDAVYVATDHPAIADEVKKFGGLVQLTASSHENGTSRCAELLANLEKKPAVVINIQGDEPFFNPTDLDALIACFKDSSTQIATLVKHIEVADELDNPTVVKAVFDKNDRALYFSRAPIPFNREGISAMSYKHIGIYAYRFDVLPELVKLPATELETIEKLEQLRWLENGYTIKIAAAKHDSNSVDTPEDLEKLKRKFNL
jgi:3-deoxy-manno-octulosonate cytidylyltransferase (CMP-KDO synthetase)